MGTVRVVYERFILWTYQNVVLLFVKLVDFRPVVLWTDKIFIQVLGGGLLGIDVEENPRSFRCENPTPTLKAVVQISSITG